MRIKPGQRLPKAPTGIQGLDEILDGGLPCGRPTLVCGSAGCGKTILAMEFLVHGAVTFGEPGVYVTFEESAEDLARNVASLGFDVARLVARKKLLIDQVILDDYEVVNTGEFNLDGLFIRLNAAIQAIGAKRVVLDTLESLFAALPNPQILRAELQRLFRWLKQQGVTAVITGESGDRTLTRQGLEEYVSDCVINLDQRVAEQSATRRLRVVKYRGSLHGSNEYPFLIGAKGVSILPVTSVGLTARASVERVSTGVPQLDHMLEGAGYFRGSSVLISGTAGSGKSSLAAHFAEAACRRGERALYFAFEESASQIMRNMRSIGVNLAPWHKNGRLQFHAARPTNYGLEMHLMAMHHVILEFQPQVVVVDPVNSLLLGHSENDIKWMLLRLVDFLKMQGITALFTSLTETSQTLEHTDVAISSLVDTWLLLRDLELGGERNRVIYVLKSRGMAHSNQVREFLLTSHGIELRDAYLGATGMLTGSARLAEENQAQADTLTRQQEIERKRLALDRRRKGLEAQIAAMRGELEAEEAEAFKAIEQEEARLNQLSLSRAKLSVSRQVVAPCRASSRNPPAFKT